MNTIAEPSLKLNLEEAWPRDHISRLAGEWAYSRQLGWKPNPEGQQVGEQHKPEQKETR